MPITTVSINICVQMLGGKGNYLTWDSVWGPIPSLQKPGEQMGFRAEPEALQINTGEVKWETISTVEETSMKMLYLLFLLI